MHRQIETWGNQSSTTTFILLGFGNLLEVRISLFILFLPIYAMSIIGNLLIVLLVAIDQHLHTPMYFFLMNLSCLEIGYISTTLPRMLASFLTEDRSISLKGCITQYFFVGLFVATECYLLAMMSYDRYLAICKPLHYTTLMSNKFCLQLAFTIWVSAVITSGIITASISQLTFCGPNRIDHFFCDIYPLANLACTNAPLVKMVTFVLGIIGIIGPFGLTLTSYIFIIGTILRIKSKASQKKAFSTCSSHLTVVTLFYGSLFLVYLVPETDTLRELHTTFSLFYTFLTPLLNPIIYSLRNKEVKEALLRTVRKFSSQIS